MLAACNLLRDDTSAPEDYCPATWAEISDDYTELYCTYFQSCSLPLYSSMEVCKEANTVEEARCFDGCLWQACLEALPGSMCTYDETFGTVSQPMECIEASRSSCP